MTRRLLSALLAVTCLVGVARAHERSVSYSTWALDGRKAHVTVRLTRLETTHLSWWSEASAERRLATYLQGRLRLLADTTPCQPDGPPQWINTSQEWLALGWDITCPPEGALHIESSLFLDVAPSHLHIARVARPNLPAIELALTNGEPGPILDEHTAAPTTGTSLFGYIALGVEHILTGYDHLAFLFALLLLGDTLAAVAQIVTGFTVGHSITLALAALGVAHANSTAIEALIGLSIALVAIENVWVVSDRPRGLPMLVVAALLGLTAAALRGFGKVPAVTLGGLGLFVGCYFALLGRVARPDRLRWAVALLFGLIHGFGFAGVLLEAELPPDRLLAALFGFNAGVELGQIALVAAVWPLWRLLGRAASARGLAIELGSAVAAGLGLFWFVSRAFF